MGTLVELLEQLVAIDSTNPEVVPGGAGEAEIARFVAGFLEQIGLEVTVDEVAPGRPNVVGVIRGSDRGRSLMLLAHLDTVRADQESPARHPKVVGNRLYGPGACDMKAGLTVVLGVADAARKLELPGDIVIAAVVDEEHSSLGSRALVKRWRTDAAIIPESTELQVCAAHYGSVWLEVETTHTMAHAERREDDLDARSMMQRVVIGLKSVDRALKNKPKSRLLGSGSLQGSMQRADRTPAMDSERATLLINRRTVPGEYPELVAAQIQRVVDRLTSSVPGFNGSVRTVLAREPFEVSEDEAIVTVLRHHAATVLGREPEVVVSGDWMDSGILAAAGIATVVFGPGGGGRHSLDEWTDLDQLQSCFEVLVETTKEFCR